MKEESSKTIKDFKNDFSSKQILISLVVIMFLGLIVRIVYFPFNLPIIADGLDYFSYSYQMSQTGNFPKDWALSNNLWPAIVSFFINIFEQNTFLETIAIQRTLTVLISVFTTVPTFFLCKKFFNNTTSMIGASIFIFEPRIILNSSNGIIEPLYILIGITTLVLFLNKDRRSVYTSFCLAGIFALLRWEGFLLIFGMVPLYVTRFRYEKRVVLNTIVVILIFVITITPMMWINLENTEKDGLIGPLLTYGPGYINDYIIQENTIDEYVSKESGNKIFVLMGNAVENTVKFSGWIMIPSFITLLPISILIILKNNVIRKWSFEKTILLVCAILLFLPAVYAYSRNFNDIRYLFVLFPIFSMVSSVFLNKILEKNSKKKLISILIILGIIVSSILFLEITKSDYELEKERYNIAKFIVANADGVNLSSFTKYFTAAEMENNWPNIPKPNLSGHVTPKTMKFEIKESSVIQFIQNNKNKGLTHIISEDMSDSIVFQDVYINSENYPFLVKIYDGNEEGMNSKVKIFKIDFEKI